MSIIGSNILAGAAGQGGGYTIERSVRLRSSASAYLSRTPASAGNRKTFTISFWMKRGSVGNYIIRVSEFYLYLSGDNLNYYDLRQGSNGLILKTNAVYRDFSAWYHVMLVVDTTQATASNRSKLYVNGEQVISFSTATYQNLNEDSFFNSTTSHLVGGSSGNYYDGYLTEVNFIDGQALTPSDFGNYNEDTGVWQPAKYIGSYGTNGFYLPFSDNTTTTTLTADASGNGNDWTANNISLTSGVTYDSMTDTPTPYADGGNYATWNPLDGFGTRTFSNGNLECDVINSGATARNTISVNNGKWYCEFTPTDATNIGVGAQATIPSTSNHYYRNDGQKEVSGVVSAYGASYTNNDVIGVALDIDGGTITFYKNGASQGAITLTSGVSQWFIAFRTTNSTLNATTIINFGQRPFAYTPPTGFKPLHTGNLPDSSIVDGSKYFDAVTYAGDGTSGRSITGLEFQPDLTWIKSRTDANNHSLYDVARGAQNLLISNTTDANQSDPTGLLSFNSDGFSVGTATRVNGTSRNYVAWNWKANGAGVSNTDGSITSTVSANPTAGFSIVSYTGTGSAATVGHGLGVAPKMVIVKSRSSGSDGWPVYHASIGANYWLALNLTNAAAASTTFWNNTAPNSSVFSISTNSGVNTNTGTYIAYCFAEVEGYSKFGSYTGNGSSDGPFVFTNFRPAFLAFKRTDSTSDWTIHDNRRLGYNTNNFELYPSGSYAETGSTSSPRSEFFANGFKIRGTSGGINASGGTYIYMAFSENPFKNSLAR